MGLHALLESPIALRLVNRRPEFLPPITLKSSSLFLSTRLFAKDHEIFIYARGGFLFQYTLMYTGQPETGVGENKLPHAALQKPCANQLEKIILFINFGDSKFMVAKVGVI